MNYDLLISHAVIYPHPGQNKIIDQGFVAVKDGMIAALGPMSDLPLGIQATQVKSAAGRLVMPGLINCHCHAAMSLFRGLADDLPLMEWLNKHIFPAEAKFVNEEMVYWCSKLAAAEMIMAGTTMVADGYFYEGQAAQAFAEIGLRAVAAQGVIDFPAPGVPDPSQNIWVAADHIDQWQESHPLIQPAVFCHSPYTCSPATLEKAKELARKREVPFFIHLAETTGETAQILNDYGKSPTRHLADLGVLDADTICVHCVCLNKDDLDCLTAAKAKIVTCPESNMKLASGIAPLPEMIRRGIKIGLGSDGCASNNDLDLFREMDMLAKLHKVHSMDPIVLSAAETISIATTGGANVLGLKDGAGILQVGSPADMVVLDIDRPHFIPFYNPDLLVYSARGGDVRDVVINGKVVLSEGNICNIDLEETKAKVRKLAEKVRHFTR